MLSDYRRHAEQRQAIGLPPLPLSAPQTAEAIELVQGGDDECQVLLDLLEYRVEPGVSKAARIKATWLRELALGMKKTPLVSPERAIDLLAGMGGGYNVAVLVELLELPSLADASAAALARLIKIYSNLERVAELAEGGNPAAARVMSAWARGEWFTALPELPETMTMKIYKVDGEVNTDDFSPGNQAQSRADIPLHATFFGRTRFPGGIAEIAAWRRDGHEVAFAGDVVGTGSSRKSAVNSLLWHIGHDLSHVPNKRVGGVVLGGIIAPIFLATARDAGVLAVEGEVGGLLPGEVVTLYPQRWRLLTQEGKDISLKPRPATLLQEYRAGGRLQLIIGRQLTERACQSLRVPLPEFFAATATPAPASRQGYTLAQKMVGKACGLPGVVPGTVCEPKMTTVGSQDTTGPMTIQEVAELGCLRFTADLYMQSFCHTAAYPKASDFPRWQAMEETAVACGGVALKPGDGVIHSWLNKMLLPDTVGTGGDSHTRFPLGISFPAGSGLVAFAAALGFMPLEMPPSVLVRFHGQRRPGITVRDMVNAIPFEARRQGLLTVAKRSKKNIFAGAVLEIEGVDDLNVDEAFELSDASAERSAAACTVSLPLATVVDKVRANVAVLRALVGQGYRDRQTLERRIAAMESWLGDPQLLKRDGDAKFLAILDIDLAAIDQPLLACPNDPDDVRPLSEVAGQRIDEAFIGSCMTHADHLRAAARLFTGKPHAEAKLWIAPATRLDRQAVAEEGALATFAQVGARVEIPGCSLCMGNQARVKPGATVISTSTRNFDNRLGDGARVFLASTELTAISALKGFLPTPEEYFRALGVEKETGMAVTEI